MRIISGDFKGRKLMGPQNNRVRPTPEKVKEALFSMLMNNIYDRVFCDLFAGTGALGLEAISRGARACYFGDVSGSSIKMIEENIRTCGAEGRSIVIPGDFERVLNRIDDQVDVFILDPPYDSNLGYRAMEEIRRLNLLSEDGLIVYEHPRDVATEEICSGYRKKKSKRYGSVVLSTYI